MRKLSEDSKKKIADAVKRSWALRRARVASAKTGTANAVATKPLAKGRRRLSADAKRRIAEAVKRSWAFRRAGKPARPAKLGSVATGGGILAAVERATNALRSATLEDLRPLTGRRDAAVRLDELAALASDLKRLITV
jgi:hypothetical protein